MRRHGRWLWGAGLVLALVGRGGLADEPPAGFSPAFEEAWELRQAGRPAKLAFGKILADESAPEKDRFSAAYVLAVISLSEKKPDEALLYLDQAEKITPERPQVAVRRGEALTAQKKYREAARELVRARKKLRSKKKSDLYYRHQMVMARLEHVTGATKPAVARLERVAGRFKKRWEVHYTLGTLYEVLDDPKRALGHYEMAIQLDPGTDPHPGIYALQRWAAVTISSNPDSYARKELVARAIERYDLFLARAKANAVSPDFVAQVTQARDVLQQFGAK